MQGRLPSNFFVYVLITKCAFLKFFANFIIVNLRFYFIGMFYNVKIKCKV